MFAERATACGRAKAAAGDVADKPAFLTWFPYCPPNPLPSLNAQQCTRDCYLNAEALGSFIDTLPKCTTSGLADMLQVRACVATCLLCMHRICLITSQRYLHRLRYIA